MGFDAFVQANQAQLQRAAWLLTGDWASAEDLTQDVLLRTWRRWDRLRVMAMRDAYVHKVLVTTFLTRQRRLWTRERPTSEFEDLAGSSQTDGSDASLDLIRLVRSLPPKQRTVLALRYIFDYTEAEVASVMGTSIGTVKSQHAKALKALRADVDLASRGY